MPQQNGFLFGQTGRRGKLTGLQVVRDLLEEPRAAIRTAADHHAISARAAQRLGSLLLGGNVAVYDEGDADGILDAGDKIPVRRALVKLLARAPVHGNHGNARLLRDARQHGGVQAAMVPAHAHF